jgi:nucleoid-associated protein YgaU
MSTPRTYMVVDGDTPSRISNKLYKGNPLYWAQLLDFNGIRDPRTLVAGMILNVPPISTNS